MSTTLMHPRVAQNYENLGYYPTDDATMRGIGNVIKPSQERIVFLDPCCGCATALNQLSSKDRFPFAERYGIELDEDRANTANGILDRVLYASALDTHVTPQSIDCLFLNPPYGWALSDKESDEKSERLEHQFLFHFFSSINAGGLLIYIVPKSSLNERIQKWLVTRFENIQIFEAATDRFDQIVIMGIKRQRMANINQRLMDKFYQYISGQVPWPKLLSNIYQEIDLCSQYKLKSNDKTLRMFAKELDAQGINDVKAECKNLWHDFELNFSNKIDNVNLRPLNDLTDWHTCLLISSGVVGGILDNGKRRLLVKGKTVKTKMTKYNENLDGEIVGAENRDRFKTVIKAIDLTANSTKFGNIIYIQ